MDYILHKKLINKEQLTDQDYLTLAEDAEFLETIISWLHWNEEKKGFEIGFYGDGFIGEGELQNTTDYIHEYLEKRG